VPGSGDAFNQQLEKAGRVADFLEFGELMCLDAPAPRGVVRRPLPRGVPGKRARPSATTTPSATCGVGVYWRHVRAGAQQGTARVRERASRTPQLQVSDRMSGTMTIKLQGVAARPALRLPASSRSTRLPTSARKVRSSRCLTSSTTSLALEGKDPIGSITTGRRGSAACAHDDQRRSRTGQAS